MEKKMTYVVALDKALSVVTDAEVAERLTALKTTLEKRKASHKKVEGPSKVALANAAIGEKIIGKMEPNFIYGTADIVGIIPEAEKFSTSKITAVMKPLVADGRVVAGKVKGKVTYTLA